MSQNVSTDVLSELRDFSQLVDLIYQGATNFEVWPSVLEGICKYIDAPRSVMFTPQHIAETGGFILGHNFSKQIEVWETKMHKHDLFAQRAFERGLAYAGCVMRDQDLLTDAELLESLMYKEVFQPIGCGRLLSGVIFSPLDNDEITVACSLHRELERPYRDEHVEKYKLILPHMSRALGVMFRLRDTDFRVAASLHALDMLPNALLLLNSEGHVIFNNKAAKRILNQQDGISLRSVSARKDFSILLIKDQGAQLALDIAISSATKPNIRKTQHFSKSLLVPRPSGKSAYILNFSSLSEQNEYGLGGNTPKAIVFIKDSAIHVSIDQEFLRNSYGLSSAEVRLAELLANGYSNEEATESLQVSINTIKTQLQQIYLKTNTNSRAKLTKMLLSMVVDADVK